MMNEILSELEEELTDRRFLRKLGWNKKEIVKILHSRKLRLAAAALMNSSRMSCADVLDFAYPFLEKAGLKDRDGWLEALFLDGKHVLFPENFERVLPEEMEKAKIVFMQILRFWIRMENRYTGFDPTFHFALAEGSELDNSLCREEYDRFLRFLRSTNLLEFMRIAAEVTPFNTLGHIAGVHHVAMTMARQLDHAGAPVDLALMSAAAIGHDVGKFGCKDKEARRVPYLHYYYTDLCLKRNEMPDISYIAANHSTWDLELENLSMESLLLIYADFRVKSTRENGVEVIHFYTLKESFDVILGKLDNVDEAKRRRYEHVYAKLVDFENYMYTLGVHTDLVDQPLAPPEKVDPVLLNGDQIVEAFKNSAVMHNVSLMHNMNNEYTFGNVLESARSAKEWKNVRTYLNVIREYGTYMNQRQKIMSINYLYELMMHRESDIRNNAAKLIGHLIAGFDIEYRKELPEGKELLIQEITSLELFREFLHKTVEPDHKLTEQHRHWVGYKMSTLCQAVLMEVKPSVRGEYLRIMTECYHNRERDSFTAYSMMHNARTLPVELYTEEEKRIYLDFSLHFAGSGNIETQTAILDYLLMLLEHDSKDAVAIEYAYKALEIIPDTTVLCLSHLRFEICRHLGLYAKEWSDEILQRHISRAFLDNLKGATPWICKVVNIRFMMENVRTGGNRQPVHTVIHMANLMTAADCIDVREAAGNAILAMAEVIPADSYEEVVVELLHILELGDNDFSSTIPEVLSRLILRMHYDEVREFLLTLEHILISGGDGAACATLDTVGLILQYFPPYLKKYPEYAVLQRDFLLGILTRGMASEHEEVAQEAFFVMGETIFGSRLLTLDEKYEYFRIVARKAFHILNEQRESNISFLIDAAALNHIYRFISEYILEHGELTIERQNKVAFFPGTFDPFSLSHKGIVEEIRQRGYEVYLAIDEFSWSKKTLPHLLRRKIASMSNASDQGVFLFPDEVPVNIANPRDLKVLQELFSDRQVYIVAGSDVTANASAYKKMPEPYSIHHFNHIIFRRHGEDYEKSTAGEEGAIILGEVEQLTLPMHLEDISSTRIRENIDLNRDISHLIDPMVQRFIYENNLYLREPQYKPMLMIHPITAEFIEQPKEELLLELRHTVLEKKKNPDHIMDTLRKASISVTVLRDQEHGGIPVAMAVSRIVYSSALNEVFDDLELTQNIRARVRGAILLVEGVFAPEDSKYHDYFQMVITELMAHHLSRETGYCIYYSRPEMEERRSKVTDTMERQGFVYIPAAKQEDVVMLASMHRPYIISGNIETVIKAPFNTNPRVRAVVAESHRKLQRAIAAFDPGHLTLSFDSAVMHYRLMNKITEYNHVPNRETKPRQLGEKMCVPFGKMLRGSITPNTVTKALHTEKVYRSDMHSFDVEEYPNYSPLKTQIRTIQSFDREVILIDDILNSGERLKKLQLLLDESEVKVSRVLTGIMTGNGRDRVSGNGYSVDSVYFIPDLRAWFVESTLYPFIGGDSIRSGSENAAGLITSINTILPYAAPRFLMRYDIDKVYAMSMICLENARDILRVLEQEYQKAYEKNLTLDRLGEVILSPTCPDEGQFMSYHKNLPASVYVENDIARLVRLRGVAQERK